MTQSIYPLPADAEKNSSITMKKIVLFSKQVKTSKGRVWSPNVTKIMNLSHPNDQMFTCKRMLHIK